MLEDILGVWIKATHSGLHVWDALAVLLLITTRWTSEGEKESMFDR